MRTIFKIEYWCSIDDSVWLESTEYKTEKPNEVTDIDDLHHILITQLPLNYRLQDYDFISQEVILANGETLVKRDYKNFPGENEFVGRDKEELRFKVGDVVKYIDGDEFYTGVVYGLPPKKGRFKKGSLDDSDDCYTILAGLNKIPEEWDDDDYIEYHQHIPVTEVFPIA